MKEYCRLIYRFNRKALDYPNLIRMIVKRKGKEFVESYPNSFDVSVRFFDYDYENIVNYKVTLSIEGKLK